MEASEIEEVVGKVSKIEEYLRSIRNDFINNPEGKNAARKLFSALTSKKDWTNEECQSFYEFILEKYIIDDPRQLKLLKATSGLLDGYRNENWTAAKRRRKYLENLQKISEDEVPDASTLLKHENRQLLSIAESLKRAFDAGTISKLLEEWKMPRDEDGSESMDTAKDTDDLKREQQSKSTSECQPNDSRAQKNVRKNVDSKKTTITNMIGSLIQIHKEKVDNRTYQFFIQRPSSKRTPPKHHKVQTFKLVLVAILLLSLLGVGIYGGVNFLISENDTDAMDLDEIYGQVQNRIVNLDDPIEEYIGPAYEEIKQMIIQNPVYGDMLARGLCDIKISENDTVGSINPWMWEFIQKTNAAMDLPLDQHPRGMEYWLVYRNNALYVTEEYATYAAHLCAFLDLMTIVGVWEWESIENWCLPTNVVDSNSRTERSTEQGSWPAIVFQYSDSSGNAIVLFGLCLYDGRLMIYSPTQIST